MKEKISNKIDEIKKGDNTYLDKDKNAYFLPPKYSLAKLLETKA